MPHAYGEPQIRTVIMMEKKKKKKKNSCSFDDFFVFIWPFAGHQLKKLSIKKDISLS